MPLLLPIRALAARSDFYRQIAGMVQSGITLPNAMDRAGRLARTPSLRQASRSAVASLASGQTLNEALRAQPRVFSRFDCALLEAGERSGRLDATLRTLAEDYDERARLWRQALTDVAYPALIVHVAILLAPLPSLVLGGNPLEYLTRVLSLLAPIYIFAFGLVRVFAGTGGGRWRDAVHLVTGWLPLVGRAQSDLALSRLAAALNALLAAGMNVVTAWPLAAEASGSPGIIRRVASWPAQLESGLAPGELLMQATEFREPFVSEYVTGEGSGRLDENLQHLEKHFREEGLHRTRLIARWLPWLIYLGVLGGIATWIVRFWMNYYGNVLNSVNF